MNEPTPALEQRVAALESLAAQSTPLIIDMVAASPVITEAFLEIKKETLALFDLQSNFVKLLARCVPDKEHKAEILSLVARGQSYIEQQEAKYEEFQKLVDAFKRNQPSRPPSPPPAS